MVSSWSITLDIVRKNKREEAEFSGFPVLKQRMVKQVSKKKNKDLQHNKAMQRNDVEFAQNGLEKVALKAQEKHNK
jgi:hypothetical protein